MEDNKEKVVICIHCGNMIKDDWKFCPQCTGSQEKVKCIKCKEEISMLWKYCPHCTIKVNRKQPDIFDTANDWIKNVLGN